MKKLLSALFALTILISLACTSTFAWKMKYDDTFTLGDTNGDDAINGKDALTLRQYIAQSDEDGFVSDAADINADGVVSARDSVLLKASLADDISLSDYENGKSVYKLTIGGVSVEEFCILLEEGTVFDSNAHYAAEIMQKYIKIATGFEPEIATGTPTKEHSISFHAVELSSETGQELGLEGYIYRVENGNLDIYGTRRGNMYAAHEILENFLGFRFYNGQSTYLYKSRTVDISDDTDVEFIPKFWFRYCAQSFEASEGEEYYLPRKLNGRQVWGFSEERYGTVTGPHFINAHSFIEYLAMVKGNYTDDAHLRDCYNSGYEWINKHNESVNPSEQYTVTNWQPCPTDSTVYADMFLGLVRTCKMVTGWGQVFRTDEGTSAMSFSINDNSNYCKCRSCNNLVKTEGHSGAYVKMANKAAVDIQEYYPGLKIFLIIYEHTVPKTVRPDSHLIICYCRIGCSNHFLGTDDCGDNLSNLGTNNKADNTALVEWGKLCNDNGARLLLWYYPETTHYYLAPCPNIINIYYDFKYLYEQCGLSGIYYEGGGVPFNFEYLKAFLASKMMYEPDMSYEQFTDYMKEYLYMYYGSGSEELYQYILLQNAAGDASGYCFNNDFDRPGDMYSYAYLAEHYEEMRALLVTALGKANDSEQAERVKTLIMTCDFLGLSSAYDSMYTNGTPESIATYKERYDSMYNRIVELGQPIFSSIQYTLPAEIDYTVNPMIQFYDFGTRRDDPNAPWGTLKQYESRT